MISATLADALRRPPLYNQRLFCVAFTLSIGLYWAAIWVTSSRPLVTPIPSAIEVFCWAGAGAATIASVIYRRRVFSTQYLSGLEAPAGSAEELAKDARTGKVIEDFRRRIEALSEPERNFLALFQRFQPRLIVSLALHETVALFGFVSCYLNRDPASFLPFAVVATGLNLWVWPSPARFEERVGGQIMVSGTRA